jgi:hypothetical protein
VKVDNPQAKLGTVYIEIARAASQALIIFRGLMATLSFWIPWAKAFVTALEVKLRWNWTFGKNE